MKARSLGLTSVSTARDSQRSRRRGESLCSIAVPWLALCLIAACDSDDSPGNPADDGGAAGSDAPGDGGGGADARDAGDDAGADAGDAGERCTDGARRTVACGRNDRGEQPQVCDDGSFDNDGECDDPDECVDDADRDVTCGLNGAGEQAQSCDDGQWENEGGCVDPDACTNAATQNVACGFNGAGAQEQTCTAGQWQNTGSCVDPDACTNAATQNVTCGLNATGTQAQTCTAGQWQNDAACVDPDVCTNGSGQNLPCGVGDDGLQAQTCTAGQWQNQGTCTYAGWTCDFAFYGTADDCDCDCGAYDPDCDVPGLAVLNCEHLQTCNLQGECEGDGVPAGWTCTDTLYDDVDGLCDCGCGIVDVDCSGPTQDACDVCDTSEGSCALDDDCSAIYPPDNTECGSVTGWNCPPHWYGDDACDCGCGVVDMDCLDANASSCDSCTQLEGSCSPDDCSTINPTNNAVCD